MSLKGDQGNKMMMMMMMMMTRETTEVMDTGLDPVQASKTTVVVVRRRSGPTDPGPQKRWTPSKMNCARRTMAAPPSPPAGGKSVKWERRATVARETGRR